VEHRHLRSGPPTAAAGRASSDMTTTRWWAAGLRRRVAVLPGAGVDGLSALVSPRLGLAGRRGRAPSPGECRGAMSSAAPGRTSAAPPVARAPRAAPRRPERTGHPAAWRRWGDPPGWPR
jgi:hypothetical protein